MVPGYGRLAQKYSTLLGRFNFRSFRGDAKRLILNLSLSRKVDLNVVSFSGSKTFYEQLYSLLSFYYNIGIPKKWTIYSDKSHLKEQIQLLQSIPNVEVVNWDNNLMRRYEELIEFGKFSVFGNRLHAYLNHPIEGTTIFTDSDILFFNKFSSYIPTISSSNWFIADTGPHFDSTLLDKMNPNESVYVNAGFLILNEAPDWEVAVSYIANLPNSKWEHFTEQSSIHLMLMSGKHQTLNNADFILNCSDSFSFGIEYKPFSIAMRHYVSPVRHKMWQVNWKKILGIVK
jgi:hypothetical protein